MTLFASVLSTFGDGLDFIVDERTGRGGGQVGGLSANGDLAWEHLKLCLVAMAIACAVALPLGLWLGHTRRAAFLAISVSNIGRAVPAIALLFVFFAFLGAGFANVALALTLLAIPPILTNAYVGVREVDPDAVDAARGVGMTGPQLLRRVELPLAMPLVFGGIRTSAVNVVATATIAPLAGVVTLGDPIINPSIYGEEGRLGAAILVALLAVATEVVLAGAQRAVTPRGLAVSPRRRLMTRTRTILAALAALALMLGVVACGDDDDSASSGGGGSATQEAPAAAITKNAENASTTLTIGSKNFTEQKVLGEIYAQAFAAAGYKVRKELNLGDEQTALKALKGGQIDGYPEYTGTALLSFFEVPTKDLPKDPTAAYDEVKSRFAKDGITAFPPTPFTSSNEVAVTQETADKLGLKKISDLEGKSQDLVLYGSPECRGRDDCLRGLQKVYGLKFKRFVPVDIAQRHEVLTNGDADLSIVFTTDPQISRNREVLLEDDKGMFPPYNSTFLMKTAIADKAGPDLQKTIEAVNKNLTARVMQELNARVDLDKETPAEAASDYLQQFDLVGAGS